MNSVSRVAGVYVEDAIDSVLHALSKIPGSKAVGAYIAKSHQNDPARTVFEILLAIFALRYFLASKQSEDYRYRVKLDEKEVDELCKEWEPVPLVENLVDPTVLREIPVLERNGPHVRLEGSDRELLNLSSTDVYDFSHNKEVEDVAIQTIRRYGVGSCGPAGFYGNQAAHIEAERAISNFLGSERSILYAQGMSTAISVIPCFAKRSDILVCDSRVNMALQKGVLLSRAKVLWFQHNDLVDLEKKLVQAVRTKHRGLLPRRIIITEGLFEYTGDSPDLKKIVELKKKYKFRLLLDESWSLGALGATGRGICEAQSVDRKDVDITVGSLATFVGGAGGFCAGASHIVEHQRIVSLAYTFSATCPPYLAEDIVKQCALMEDPSWVKDEYLTLKTKAASVFNILKQCPKLELISVPGIPVVIFRLKNQEQLTADEQSKQVGDIVMECRVHNILISRLHQIARFELYPYIHAIRLYIPSSVGKEELDNAAKTISKIISDLVK